MEVSEAGLWRLPVPEHYGGSGKSWWEFVAGLEGLASTSRDFGFLISTIAQAGAIFAVLEFGSDRQKARLLGRLMRGDIASTAATEAHGGSDVSSVRTTAQLSDNRLLLTGRKAHITNAPIASIFVVLGRIPSLGERKDITLFVLERGQEGLSTSSPERTLGNCNSPTGEITLANVLLEEHHILGAPGDGLRLLYQMLSLDRPLFGVVSSAFAEPILSDAIAFASGRESFNRPLTEHQYVQDKIVRMKTNMEVAKFVSYAALERLFSNKPDAILLSSIAKMVGTEGLWDSSQELMQLQGHTGYEEGEVSWLIRDVVAARIAGGTSEMQKVCIFNQIQKLHRLEKLQ